MNSTPHTSHFLVDSHFMTRTCVAQAQVWRAQCTFHIISCVIFMRSCCVFDSPRLFLPPLAVYLLSYRLFHLPSATMWWTNSLHKLLMTAFNKARFVPGVLGSYRIINKRIALSPLPSATLQQMLTGSSSAQLRRIARSRVPKWITSWSTPWYSSLTSSSWRHTAARTAACIRVDDNLQRVHVTSPYCGELAPASSSSPFVKSRQSPWHQGQAESGTKLRNHAEIIP